MEEAKQQDEAINTKMEIMEEIGGMAHELFGFDVAFYAAMKLEGRPSADTNDEAYGSMNLEELLQALDSVNGDKTLDDALKNEKLRVIVNRNR